MPRPRFTIRELILVVALVAVVLGWALDHARLSRNRDNWREQAEEVEAVWRDEQEASDYRAETLEAEVNGLLHEQGRPEKYPVPGQP